ncbi:MAG: BolA family protein [Candidatus Neomarinimicrobiota bacterium]|jgi:stress-induced morphogen|nr:BolA family transcriptional regulator [Candidatus Neomarinimicrobiota bacterium]MDP6261992.1 BolA family protein [Candidatus Neomarinimicrobiota bacterium]MDP7126635.1 BolA family protein [Candidatus Neomarinimicrobiota bacterium]MDP7566043.1 BolA family protein [Candidatus Neomarinimicrobiota bacterium]MEE1506064.1 BolA family protein [Candidatus Neomarinimicrobiota bacterium]
MDQIIQKLKQAFPGADIELKNTSSMHVGHNAKGMHLKTIINYRGFKGKSLIEQHRMVQKALEAELGNEIHALSIKTIIK